MEKNSAASLLTSVDSLFTTQEERDTATQPRVQEIPIDQIDDFPNHPFKVRMRKWYFDFRKGWAFGMDWIASGTDVPRDRTGGAQRAFAFDGACL